MLTIDKFRITVSSILAFSSAALNAQDCTPDIGCTFSISAATNIHQIGTSTSFVPVSVLNETTRTGRFLVLAGETYEWSTREADGGASVVNTELTLFNNLANQRLCYGNDSDGNGAFIQYTSPVDQQLFVRVTQAPCTDSIAAVQVVWRCASCVELPEVRVPVSGSVTVACGSNVRLRDAGGLGYYPNGTDGYARLLSVGGVSIHLKGSHSIEPGYDRLTMYNGLGTAGAIIALIDDHGFFEYTHPPGQSLTVRFRSDENVFYSGFDLEVSYDGSCTEVGITERENEYWSVFPNPTQGRITLQTDHARETPQLRIWDSTGRTVNTPLTSMVNAGRRTDLSLSVPPGYYFIQIIDTDHEETHRVIIE